METLSGCILRATGETVINRALINYYRAHGGVGTTLPDLERSFLIAQGAVPATNNGMWRQLLTGLGYTGTLNGMKKRFWCETQGELANVYITPAAPCPNPGDTLTAGISDTDGVPGAGITYTWFADGAPIAGATASTYLLTMDEQGKQITVNVQYTSTGGTPRDLTSAPTCAIGTTNPTVTAAETDAAGTTLTITLSEPVTGSSGFSLLADGAPVSLSAPGGSGTAVITFATQVYSGQLLRLSYAPGDVVDAYANPLLAFDAYPVVNGTDAQQPPIFTGTIADFVESEGVAIAPRSVAPNFASGPTPLSYSLDNAPPWMTIDSAGVIRGTPTDDTDYLSARVAATNVGGTTYSAPFSVIVEAAVVFTVQPISQLLEAGGQITLAVIAENAVSYQWYRDGVAIAGANAAEYSYTPSDPTEAYHCRCTNINGDAWDSAVAYGYPVTLYSNQVLEPGPEVISLVQQRYTVSVVGTGVLAVSGDTATIEAA